jgi:hypothetical protein
MAHEIPEITFKSIDLDNIEDVEENAEAFQFDVLLSQVPPPEWAHEFDYLYRIGPYVIKPPVELVDDRLKVIFLPRYSDNLQGFLDFLATVVHHSTEEARRTIEIRSSDSKERRRQDFRQTLKRIHLPRVELVTDDLNL